MRESKAAIVLCQCSERDPAFTAALKQVLAALEKAGVGFQLVRDFCELAARKDSVIPRMFQDRPLHIVACYPRSIKWLLHAAGHPVADAAMTVWNLRAESPDTVVGQLLQHPNDGHRLPVSATNPSGNWVPWFPVIDYDRCCNCRQCHDYCLFGVYEVDAENKVAVVHPQNCKTNCPACARICPEVAIIFPKYNQAPINGAPVEEPHRNATLANLQELREADAYALLAERRKQTRIRLTQAPESAAQAELLLRQPIIPPPKV